MGETRGVERGGARLACRKASPPRPGHGAHRRQNTAPHGLLIALLLVVFSRLSLLLVGFPLGWCGSSGSRFSPHQPSSTPATTPFIPANDENSLPDRETVPHAFAPGSSCQPDRSAICLRTWQ